MIRKVESIINYILRRFGQVCQLINVPSKICSKFNDGYHKLVEIELHHYLNRSLSLVKDHNFDKLSDNSRLHNVIWIFWWQGKKSMPPIIRKCFYSVNQHSCNHRVILITKYNIRKYAHFPKYIYNKVNNGNISLTHFSDLLRFNLLNYYGGLWIDSTIYCTTDLTNKYFGDFYTNNVGPDEYHFSVSQGYWTGFFIGGHRFNPLFTFMNTFFLLYWKYNTCLIDYFMIDFALYYAYKQNINGFKDYVDNNNNRQPHIFDLLNIMNKPYDTKIYKRLSSNTKFFKLTYKRKMLLNANNRRTFYYMLMNDRLIK